MTVDVTFFTTSFTGKLHQPGVGTTSLTIDVVRAIQMPDGPRLDFAYDAWPSEGPESVQILSMPEAMAWRLLRFCTLYFLGGRTGFDCRSFLAYIAGWRNEVTANVDEFYHGHFIGPDRSREAKPYVIATEDGPTPHAILGAREPGYSVGVMGPDYPLAFARNSDLVTAFGGAGDLLQVTRVVPA
jgi:hypothetical protein